MATGTFVGGGHSTNTDWRTGLARFGLVAKGVLYLTLGGLAVQLAGPGGGGQVSQTGAIETLWNAPAGPWLVGALALGLLAHGVWQLVITFAGDPVEGSDAIHRAKYAVKTIIYLALGGVAVSVLFGGRPRGGGEASSDRAAATLLDLPGGEWIASGIGVVVVGVGVYELVRHAWGAQFMERINRTGHGHVRRNVRRAGRAGYASLGVVAIITGAFLVVAAIRHDPEQVRGLSGSLQTLADQPWGPWLLVAVAAGLMLYGVFSLAEARYRRAG